MAVLITAVENINRVLKLSGENQNLRQKGEEGLTESAHTFVYARTRTPIRECAHPFTSSDYMYQIDENTQHTRARACVRAHTHRGTHGATIETNHSNNRK